MANYNLKQRVDGFIWGKTFCGAFPRQPISQQSSCQRASAVKRPAAPNTHLKFCQKLLLQKISCSATPADDKLWMGRWRWAADPDSGGAKLPWARQQGIACNTREPDLPMFPPCNKRHQQRNWLNLFSPHPPTWWLHHVNFDRCKLKCALKTALPRRYCTKKKHGWLRWRILCPRWAAPAAVTAPSRGSLVRILFCFHPTCYTTTIAAHCSKNSLSPFSEMIPRQTPDGHHELGSNLWEAFTGRILPPPTSGEQ